MDRSKIEEDPEQITEESFTPSDTSEKYADHENEADNKNGNETDTQRNKENKGQRDRKTTVSEGVQTDDPDWILVNKEALETDEIQDELEGIRQLAELQVFIPKRYILLFMIFLGFIVIYSMRVNLNVAIVAMVNNRTVILRSGAVRKYVSMFSYLKG